MSVADANPLALDEPRPLFIHLGYGEFSQNIQFSVWGSRENYLELRNQIAQAIRRAFDEAGIEIPVPQRALRLPAGSVPVTIVPQSTGEPAS
jgi:small-conductance mechanosensitive channel